MNKSMLTGIVIGGSLAIAAGGIASYQMMSRGPEFADVVAVRPVTERIETPREVCEDVAVTRQKPVKDQHQVTGTVVGAVAGALLGNALGGGGDNTGTKVIGAAAGGYAGNKAQEKIQQSNTETVMERRCETVIDVTENTIGYDVDYRIGEQTGSVRMDRDPGPRIPMENGELVLAGNPG
jgi:uncharacterized protein YcfJ